MPVIHLEVAFALFAPGLVTTAMEESVDIWVVCVSTG